MTWTSVDTTQTAVWSEVVTPSPDPFEFNPFATLAFAEGAFADGSTGSIWEQVVIGPTVWTQITT